jgi:hypothetical protein
VLVFAETDSFVLIAAWIDWFVLNPSLEIVLDKTQFTLFTRGGLGIDSYVCLPITTTEFSVFC